MTIQLFERATIWHFTRATHSDDRSPSAPSNSTLETRRCQTLYQPGQSPEPLGERARGTVASNLHANWDGLGCPLPRQTRKLHGTRHSPTTKYSTTRCHPRLPLSIRTHESGASGSSVAVPKWKNLPHFSRTGQVNQYLHWRAFARRMLGDLLQNSLASGTDDSTS